jgi:hypothetical protein
VSNSQFDIDGNIEINKIGESVTELYLWYTNLDLSILNQENNFLYLHETRIKNIERLNSIKCNYLKLYNLKYPDGNSLNIEDFNGEFKDFKLSYTS